MTNRLRTEIPDEEKETEIVVEEKPARAEIPENFLTQFLNNGFISADKAVKGMPFVLFMAFLGMVYIGNRRALQCVSRGNRNPGRKGNRAAAAFFAA